MTVLEFRELTKEFGDTTAVRGLSFSVPAGSVTGFLGPNGAGKTTTLRMLLGLVRPTAGTALIDGRPYLDLPTPARTVGAVLEATGFPGGLTARRYLTIATVALDLPAARVAEVLAEVGLSGAADKRIRGFSLGMRQRLAIGRALLARPKVLILDEPANGLDPAGIHWLRGLVRKFADDGGTALVSSHLLAEIEQVSDQVVVIADGRLAAAGPIDGLLDGTGAASLEEAYLRLTAVAA